MDTDLSANWSSRKPQTEAVANPIRKSNVTATQNLPENSPAVHASGSYRTDSTTLGRSQQSGTIQHVVAERANFRVSAPESRSISTEEIPLHSPAPPNSELPGFFDEYGVLRKQQIPGDGRCAEGVIATILNEFGIPEMTTEEFKQEMADEEATVANLMKLAQKKGLTEEFKQELVDGEVTVANLMKLAQKKGLTEEFKQELVDGEVTATKLKKFARKKGLKAKRYDVEEFVKNRITNIENVKAFMVVLPTSFNFFHGVAIVRPDKKERFLITKDFLESDSYDQNESKTKKYSGDTAQDALLDYETQNNIIAVEVFTFHERTSKDLNDGVVLSRRGLWKEAIEAYDKVITRFGEATEPTLRKILAKALLNKGVAHYKLKEWSRAIEACEEIITRFGEATEATEPALCELVAKARRNLIRFRGKVEQAGA
jgi:tetratricopeptide (TPR) repeat protein